MTKPSFPQTDSQTAALRELVDRIATRVEDEKEYLTDLDSKIGDADFGVNLSRGLQAVQTRLDETDVESVQLATLVKTIGEILLSEMAGSSGILFGGGLILASEDLSNGLDKESALTFAKTYEEYIAEKGDVSIGAKTMYDAVVPAVNLLVKSIEQEEKTSAVAVANALAGAQRGAKFTSTLEAKKGRASYVEARSIGHPDPGAVFTTMVLKEIHGLVQELTDVETTPMLDDSL